MNRFNTHYKNTISYDLMTKFNYMNSFEIPSIKEISINISSLNLAFEKKKIIPLLVAIELISGQKGRITLSKKNKIHLKIKKGIVVGCKVTLNTQNSHEFLEHLILFVFPHIKDFKGFSIKHKSPSILSFKINNLLNFFELNNEFLNFSNISPVNITIKLNTNTIEESNLLLNSYNFPIKTLAKVT